MRVSGPLTAEVDADWVFDGEDPGTAYIECAQACGLALLGGPPTVETALAAHSRGVGQLIAAAVDAGARPDRRRAGRQLLHGRRQRHDRGSRWTRCGRKPTGRRRADRRHRRRASAARADGRGAGVRPAEGRRPGHRCGAGAAADRLGRRSRRRGRASRSARRRARAPQAASAQACWHWVAGASRGPLSSPSTRTSADDVAAAELVITGEGRFDDQSLHGKVVSALAGEARGTPVLVLAGQVTLDGLRTAGRGHHRRLRHRRPRRIGPAGHLRRCQPAHGVGGGHGRPTRE